MRTQSRRPKTVRCRQCKGKIRVKGKGPVPTYCRHTCRQIAYEKRRHSGPMAMLAQDIASSKVRTVIRAEIWSVLREIGLVVGPLPPRKQERQRPNHLYLVDDP